MSKYRKVGYNEFSLTPYVTPSCLQEPRDEETHSGQHQLDGILKYSPFGRETNMRINPSGLENTHKTSRQRIKSQTQQIYFHRHEVTPGPDDKKTPGLFGT